MAFSLFVADKGYLDDVELKKVRSFDEALLSYLRDQHADLLAEINDKPELNDEIASQNARSCRAI